MPHRGCSLPNRKYLSDPAFISRCEPATLNHKQGSGEIAFQMKSALPRWFIAATVGASAAWAAFDFPQGERHQPGPPATSPMTAAKELDLVERLRRDPLSAQGGELFAAHDGAPARARAV